MSNKIQEKPAMTDWRMQPTRSPPPSRDGELLKSPSHQQTKPGTGGQIGNSFNFASWWLELA